MLRRTDDQTETEARVHELRTKVIVSISELGLLLDELRRDCDVAAIAPDLDKLDSALTELRTLVLSNSNIASGR